MLPQSRGARTVSTAPRQRRGPGPRAPLGLASPPAAPAPPPPPGNQDTSDEVVLVDVVRAYRTGLKLRLLQINFYAGWNANGGSEGNATITAGMLDETVDSWCGREARPRWLAVCIGRVLFTRHTTRRPLERLGTTAGRPKRAPDARAGEGGGGVCNPPALPLGRAPPPPGPPPPIPNPSDTPPPARRRRCVSLRAAPQGQLQKPGIRQDGRHQPWPPGGLRLRVCGARACPCRDLRLNQCDRRR